MKTIDINQLFDYDFIGQFYGTYLLFQNKEGLYIIDQHAASERIRYEDFKNNYNDKYLIKPLIPIAIEQNKEILKEKLPKLNEIGFDLDINYDIVKYPSYLKENDISYAIDCIINNEEDLTFDDYLKQISCKGAIKANKYLTRNECIYLFSTLLKTNNYKYCIHGRPTIIKMSITEIERLFKRVI